MNLRAREQDRYESYLTDILAPESSSVTNVFHPAQALLDGSSYKPLSSLPSVGYQPSGAASDRAKTQKTKVSSEVISPFRQREPYLSNGVP